MNITAKLRLLRVVIVTHEYATGPSHSLEAYLREKTASLTFIAHPFVFAKEKRSHMRSYDEKGIASPEIFFPWHVSFQIFNLIKDILLTFWWSIRQGPCDLYIGVNNINASIGVILQKMHFVKKTVFYTIDYVPNRSANKILNSIYHAFDKFAVHYVDRVWNLSPIMATERAKAGMSAPYLRKKQIVVPVGTDITVAPVPFSKIKRYHLAHMGHLTEKQGVQLVIEAIPQIVKHIPQFHFDIIGGGPMEKHLHQMVRDLHVSRYVTWYGFIKDHEDVERLLSKCAAAVAPYIDSPDNFVRFTDPGKVKAYLAVGLPIIITKVPDVWQVIVNNHSGVAVDATVSALSEAIVDLLRNDDRLGKFRKQADKLGENFLWARIFEKSLLRTLG